MSSAFSAHPMGPRRLAWRLITPSGSRTVLALARLRRSQSMTSTPSSQHSDSAALSSTQRKRAPTRVTGSSGYATGKGTPWGSPRADRDRHHTRSVRSADHGRPERRVLAQRYAVAMRQSVGGCCPKMRLRSAGLPDDLLGRELAEADARVQAPRHRVVLVGPSPGVDEPRRWFDSKWVPTRTEANAKSAAQARVEPYLGACQSLCLAGSVGFSYRTGMRSSPVSSTRSSEPRPIRVIRTPVPPPG